MHEVFDGAAFLVLYVNLKTVDASEARQHGLGIDLNLGIADVGRTPVDFFHHGVHVVAFSLSFIPVLQFQREVSVG